MYHASVKSFVVPVFPAEMTPQLFRAHAGAKLHNFLEHRRHRSRHIWLNHVLHIGPRLFEHCPVIGRDAPDVVRLDVKSRRQGKTVNADVCSIKVRVGGAQRQRQDTAGAASRAISQYRRANIDCVLHADMLEQPHGRARVAESGERAPAA